MVHGVPVIMVTIVLKYRELEITINKHDIYSVLHTNHKLTKFIRIGIADKNDNPPYFDKELYEAEVDENEDIQHTVLTVTAKDHDECKYLTRHIIYLIS
ncbi:unnamed protein product [Euphydryas editha]|uniref:Cadherin domain-containing protein n=1 Tax=Euphydryas editha TaxID=104508 RepID=A0AAU9V4D4_EUPED|nr:unnamed protein product [Euphydryas editha]